MERRRFLHQTLLGAAALAFPRCTTPEGPRVHVLPDAPQAPDSARVSVVRAADHPTLAAAVRAAVLGAGGLSFIRPGQTVLLKPAVNSGNRYPATADPETVYTLARMVQEAGGEPFIADRTMFLGSTKKAFAKTGMVDAAAQAKIPCLPLDDSPVVKLSHPLAESWPDATLHVYRPVAEADHVINLCTPRTHKLGDFTMALKNNVGVVAASKRARMHWKGGFKERLAEISLVVRPSLVVLDGRLGFGDGGPDEGALVKPGFVAAGTDPVAVDAVGLAFLRLAGANDSLSKRSIWSIPLLKHAAELGVGVGSAQRIRLDGMDAGQEKLLRAQMA